MTTIVANKDGMASDTQAFDLSARVHVTKFWRIKGWLVGGAGTYDEVLVLVEMLKGSPHDPYECLRTELPGRKVKDVDLLLLSPQGHIYQSENAGIPYKLRDKFGAIGSGAQGALVAMHLGATIQEAIRAVKKVDPFTGGRLITRKI